MQIRNALRVAILIALYSFAGAYVTAHAGSGAFCYWTRSVSDARGRRSHHSFLRLSANARARSLQLYHSIWTQDRRLVDCAVTDEPAVTESYLLLCREEQVGNFTDVPETRFNVSLLLAPGNPCADPFTAGVEASKRAKRQINDPDLAEPYIAWNSSGVKLRRQKRAWIIPGTVWCGSGNKADNYDDLGLFSQTDMCCREHDHCTETIPAFKSGYGIFNRHFFTVLHCDCDDRFRECLLTANDRVSNMVGYGYFNLIKTPCFTFTEKMQCTQTNWFGMCMLSEMSPFAVLQDPTEYNSTLPGKDGQFGGTAIPAATPENQNVTSPTATLIQNITSLAAETGPPPTRRPKPRLRCRPKGPFRGTASRSGRRRGLRRRVCVEQPTPPSPQAGRGSDAARPQLPALSSAGPQLPALSSVGPQLPALSTVGPQLPALSTVGTQLPALSSVGPQLPALSTVGPQLPALSSVGPQLPALSSVVPQLPALSTVGPQLPALSSVGGGVSIGPPHQRADPSSENALPTTRPRTPRPVPHNQPAPLEDSQKTEPCDCYKHLDECGLQIPPLRERFGLKNLERKTLYHCNCTHRLAQQLQEQTEPDAVQSLLVDFVSLSCFLLTPPEDCPGTAGCPAVLSEASHLRLALTKRENPAGREYPDIPNLKVKRHDTRKSKRKRIPVRLYKKCLRIMDSQTSKRTEE